MSADRTLMSVIRTSLSLIGFGFTIAQVFQKLRDQDIITKAAAPRNFGLALVGLGIVMLVIGIIYHVQFMLGLRHLRESMREEGLIHGETIFPVSFTLVTALVLLLIGVASDHEHGVSRRTIRIGRRSAQAWNGCFALSSSALDHIGRLRFNSKIGEGNA